jgi:hypothetical protein
VFKVKSNVWQRADGTTDATNQDEMDESQSFHCGYFLSSKLLERAGCSYIILLWCIAQATSEPVLVLTRPYNNGMLMLANDPWEVIPSTETEKLGGGESMVDWASCCCYYSSSTRPSSFCRSRARLFCLAFCFLEASFCASRLERLALPWR